MTKTTQKKLAFYKLWKNKRGKDYKEYLPTWTFVGEIYVKCLNEWHLMSYKCPTRLTDIYQENPTLLERTLITGKSGAHYYGYRVRNGATIDDIKDPKLREYYELLKANEHLED